VAELSNFNRRSFLEKAGASVAAGALPLASEAVGNTKGQKKGKENHDLDDPARFGIARCVVEWSYTAEKPYADPFNDVELDVIFTDPQGNEHTVPTFWAGEQTWRIRYAPSVAGRYTYRTVASDSGDLHGRRGVLEVAAYEGNNQLLTRGPIRVAADHRHFEHEDGTPFFWLGDTWWMGLCNRMRWPEDFTQLAADRVRKGFTVVQIIAGLYPDMPPFDPRGANEAGFPWEKDYARINPAYFDAADLRIRHLVDAGLVPCLVACWGYFLPIMGIAKLKQQWRNMIARWGAYPVIWCLAGEGAMPYYLSKTKKEDADTQKRGWTEIAKYVRSTDPYHHAVTIHPTDNARNQVEDEAVIDFDMLQTGHDDRKSIPNTENSITGSLLKNPPMPVLAGEVCYEGILEASRQEIQRFMFWTCILNGAGGHTYGANGIWQVNTREHPYGPSPHGGNWGEVPWDVAAELPGSEHIGIGKALLMRYPWWRFEPHPEWVDPHWSKENYELAYAAGIPGEVRFIFIPTPAGKARTVQSIEAGVSYRAFYFDPKSGKEHDLGDVAPDSAGSWTPQRTPTFADWVLVLEKKS
jgi:hypothetical protein